MDYQEALDYISASGRFGIKMGLDRTRALLDAMGAPDAGLRGVLVGGTNGKGSTCAYLVACLGAAGYILFVRDARGELVYGKAMGRWVKQASQGAKR